MDYSNTATTLANAVKIYSAVQNYSGQSALTDITKLTRVEPIAIVSKDCLNLEYLPDVMQSLLSIFSSYYLQSIEILKLKITDVKVIKLLDSLNPDRDSTGFTLQYGEESFKGISLENMKYSLPTGRQVSLEDNNKTTEMVNEVSNLSVGKLLNISISLSEKVNKGIDKSGNEVLEDKSYNIVIPVNVRIIATVLPTKSIINILSLKKDDEGIVERYYKWKAGRISFIKDFILCQDLIDEYKRTLANDDNGVISEILRRVNNSKKFGLLTQNPSLSTASNLVVISSEAAKELEASLGGKLSNPLTRKKAFESTYAMVIAVINTDFERVTFYTRGIAVGSDLSVKEIKNLSKGKGPNILDIFKSLNQGLPPTF